MKTMMYVMTGGLVMAAMAAHAAGAGGSVGAGVSTQGGGGTGSVSAGAATSGGALGLGVGARGTGIDTGTATSGGSLGLGVNGTANSNIQPAAGRNQPSGVIDDTGRSGTSSISTQSDAEARDRTTNRAGTFSGRSSVSGSLR